jgi:hypothetical protein
MWADDAIWLPQVLKQAQQSSSRPQPFVHNFLFNDGELLAHEPVSQTELSFSVTQPRAAQSKSQS